ncbi:MAG: hypothetical protein ACLFVA_01055 [Dehalococcoidia bacterium]
MTEYILAALIAALPVICLPSLAAADSTEQYLKVVPAGVSIDNLSPGEATEFTLTICNQDEAAHNFTLATCRPLEEDRREGRGEFPNDNWIDFSSERIEVAANSEADVKVSVAVPSEQQWADKDWEIWVGVQAESDNLLTAKLYVRLLVSTGDQAAGNADTGLVVGIVAAAIAIGYSAHYWRRRTGLR